MTDDLQTRASRSKKKDSRLTGLRSAPEPKTPRTPRPADPLTQLRSEALASFQQLGFPTPKHEEWKYTNVQSLVKNGFEPVMEIPKSKAELQLDTIERLKANRLVFVDGWFNEKYSEVIDDKNHLVITPISQLSEENEQINRYLGMLSNRADAFAAWNTAYFRDGAFIHVPDNETLEHPVLLYHISTGATSGKVTAPRNLVIADKNSRSTIIVCYQNLSNEKSVTNTVTEIFLMENAGMDYVKIQSRINRYSHIGNVFVNQQDNSRFHAWTITFGGDLIRNNLSVALNGKNCETQLDGLYVLSGNDHVDNHVTVDHAQPGCRSNQLYKGILSGSANGVFCGRILVRQNAQKTNAFQANKNILLSGQATVNSKPQLEIFADDVKCTHGATSGQLDEDAVFYMRARGISEQHARSILRQAFAWEVIEKINHPDLKEYLNYSLMIALNR